MTAELLSFDVGALQNVSSSERNFSNHFSLKAQMLGKSGVFIKNTFV